MMAPSSAVAAVHTSAPAIPFKRDAGVADSPLAGGAVGVLVVSLIAIAAVLVVRKKMGLNRPLGGKDSLLKVLETQRLGPRALLSVVEFGGAQYLIAQGEHGISCVASKMLGEQP
jgi:flagellar biogenesis protein FliO